METESLFVAQGSGRREVFSASGVIRKRHNKESVLGRVSMDTNQVHVPLRDEMVRQREITDVSGAISNRVAYHSKSAAKTSLAWYIVTALCSPRNWIESSIDHNLWKRIKEEDNCRFVVVTLQNGPSHTCKWKSFATLVLKGTKCFARIEKKQSDNDEAYFLLADNVIVDESTVLPTVASVPTPEASECSASSGDSDQKRPHFKIEHPTYPTYPCNKKSKQASPRKQHSAITATDRTPMEIDPFRRSELKDPAYMKNKITLWKAHWSCQLSCWKSTYSLRSIGGTGDRYWFPPNTKESEIAVRIRSAPDLTSFLDYCVSQQPGRNVDSVEPNLLDYVLLLRQWGETRKSTRKT